ncbi:hypothetical protein TNCV_2151181 [Trichonephila clavipes]|nr:hypothetical protein TNCV_2151181 [Trichonephila clavipes]
MAGFQRSFELLTDASSIGVGAVPKSGSRDQCCLPLSPRLSSADRNYNVADREVGSKIAAKFNIEWEHRSGTQNAMADVLTRNPVESKSVFQFGLAIHQNDHQARRRFVEWAQDKIAVVPDFHKRILFSDEAHFWLNGYVNKQNCCIWSEANPQVYVETPLHPEKLTVWCTLWAGAESLVRTSSKTMKPQRYSQWRSV